jgi:hypothetical protein
MGVEERKNFGIFVMAIGSMEGITLQGGIGDADVYQFLNLTFR